MTSLYFRGILRSPFFVEREVRLIPTELHHELGRRVYPLWDFPAELAKMAAAVAVELISEQTDSKKAEFLAPLKSEMEWVCALPEELSAGDIDRAVALFRLTQSMTSRALLEFPGEMMDPASVYAIIGRADYAARIMDYVIYTINPERAPKDRYVGADSPGAFLESLEGAYRYWCATRSPQEAASKCLKAAERWL